MLNHYQKIIKLGVISLGILLFLGTLNQKAVAQFNPLIDSNGREANIDDIDKVPSLINSGATRSISDAASTYYFTVHVPQTATNALRAVSIKQKISSQEIPVNVSKTQAFLGSEVNEGTMIPLIPIGGSNPSERNEIMVIFEQPIPPGNTVTVALDVKENPSYPRIYQFGVTAFPNSEVIPPLYLGTARINIFGSN
jgi:hypothetical protein